MASEVRPVGKIDVAVAEDDVINDGGDNEAVREGGGSIKEICMDESLAGELDGAMIDKRHLGARRAGGRVSRPLDPVHREPPVVIVAALLPVLVAIAL